MKFIVTIAGPTMMYRLDIIKKSSPDIIKDYVIIFTDRYSYNLYKEKGYHNDFNFVIIDDIRNNFPISLEYEQILELPTEEEYLKNLYTFYNGSNKKLFPYDIHRFILPYLAEQNILNFAIVDSDMILNNDKDFLTEYFKSLPQSYLYMHMHDHDLELQPRLSLFLKNQHLYPEINFNVDQMNKADGYVRGFNFNSKEDLLLFFNIWNKTIEEYFTSSDYDHKIGGGNLILDLAFICPYVMQFFKSKGYTFEDCHISRDIRGQRCYQHCTRPEDTFYFGARFGWSHYNFNYSDVSNISSFIKNNKNQLREYYNNRLSVTGITDTHVYTTINENIQ